MIDQDILEKANIFKGLNKEQMAAVQGCCVERKYTRGSKIFSEGETAVDLWAVVSGQVDLRFELPEQHASEKNTIASIYPFCAFGWSSFVPPYKYGFSAYCVSRRCTLLKVDKKCLSKLFKTDAKIGYLVMFNLSAIVGERFQQLYDTTQKLTVSAIKIIVHMATCGIAAGARGVMETLMEEIVRNNQRHIQVESGGCIGKCGTEPNVTVIIEGQEPIVYQKMTSEKMRRVFYNHVLKGNIQAGDVLTAS